MATVQELLVKINGDASGFSKAISEVKSAADSIGSAFQDVGAKIESIGKTATATLTVPIVGAATKAVSSFAEVDKTMALANKTMGNTAEEAKMLESAMSQAAANSTFGMNDAATATLNFARAGLDAEQSAAALAPAMNLAAGEGGNLDTVSAGLVATINGFHGSFDDAGKYADVFAAACNNSALDVNSLSNAMSVAAPIFSTAGYKVNDAALYMGIMANAGIEAGVAANSLKTGMARLVSPAKEGAVWMEKLGIEVTNTDGSMKDSITIQKELHDAFSKLSESEQMAAASAIFGKNQMAPWLALINTAPEDVNELSDSINNCNGITDEMAETMMSGFGGSIDKLKSSIDVLMYTLGGLIAQYLQPLIDKIQEFVDKVLAMSPAEQEQIVKIGAMVAAAGPLLVVFGKIVTVVGSIIKIGGSLTSVLGGLSSAFGGAGAAAGSAAGGAGLGAVASVAAAVVAAIAAIAAAVYSLVESFGGVQGVIERFKQAFEEVTGSVKAAIERLGIGEKIENLKEKFSGLLESLGNLRSLWEIIITVLTKAADVIGPVLVAAFGLLVDAISNVVGFITGLIEIIGGLADVIVGVFTGDMEKVAEGFTRIWEGIKTTIGSVVDFIVDLVKGLVDAIKEFFSGLKYALIGDPIVLDMADGIVKAFSDFVGKAIEFVSNLKEKVVDFFSNLKEKVTDVANNIKEKVTEKFSQMKEKVTETVSNLKDKAVEKFNDLKEKATDKFNQLKEKVTDTVSNLKDKAVDKFNQMKEKITDAATNIKEKVSDKFSQVKEAISDKLSQAKEKASDQFSKMKEAISDKASQIKEKCSDMAQSIKDKFANLDLFSTGANIIKGLLGGLKDAFTAVADWVSDKVSWIIDKFKSALSIGSPSKVFAEIGKFIDQGLVIGLESGESNIGKEVDSLAKGVMNGFTGGLRATNGLGLGTRNEKTQTVNLNGDYMFNDRESMDYFLNRLGLVLQRT